jgi:ribosomal protein S18 acetylase RimI-like enzyme
MLPGRIQHYLRSVVEREREPIPAGAFVLYLHPSDTHPFLNYAIPAPDAIEEHGTELIRVARAHGRVPRLEYLESCFPWVEESLSSNGFALESRLRLMTCSSDSLGAPAADVEVKRIETGSPLVGPTLTVTQAAFGEGPPDDAAVARWKGRTVAAVAHGEVLGSASWTTVIDGMSEIAGVAVAAGARGRGIGTTLTVAAARGAFADGASMALLTPGSDATARVYERAGFRDTTTMLHLRHER